MTAFYTVEQLGPNRSLTPEGFLIVRNVPLARTGFQLYSDQEVPVKGDASGRVMIMRDEDEVFRPETISSLQGKPIALDHPTEDIVPDNYRKLAVGHTMNPRRGSGRFDNLLLGDLFVWDPDAIAAINDDNLREVSVGYEADYEDVGDGKGRQRNIIANHLAIVKDGRCGPICRIGDSLPRQIFRDACTCQHKTRDGVSKEFVNYSSANGRSERCGNCVHFIPDRRCELVDGDIDPMYWCKLFEPRATMDRAPPIVRSRPTRRHIHLHI